MDGGQRVECSEISTYIMVVCLEVEGAALLLLPSFARGKCCCCCFLLPHVCSIAASLQLRAEAVLKHFRYPIRKGCTSTRTLVSSRLGIKMSLPTVTTITFYNAKITSLK